MVDTCEFDQCDRFPRGDWGFHQPSSERWTSKSVIDKVSCVYGKPSIPLIFAAVDEHNHGFGVEPAD